MRTNGAAAAGKRLCGREPPAASWHVADDGEDPPRHSYSSGNTARRGPLSECLSVSISSSGRTRRCRRSACSRLNGVDFLRLDLHIHPPLVNSLPRRHPTTRPVSSFHDGWRRRGGFLFRSGESASSPSPPDVKSATDRSQTRASKTFPVRRRPYHTSGGRHEQMRSIGFSLSGTSAAAACWTEATAQANTFPHGALTTSIVEPAADKVAPGRLRFVIQKHAARARRRRRCFSCSSKSWRGGGRQAADPNDTLSGSSVDHRGNSHTQGHHPQAVTPSCLVACNC